jgi:hypothetical protein
MFRDVEEEFMVCFKLELFWLTVKAMKIATGIDLADLERHPVDLQDIPISRLGLFHSSLFNQIVVESFSTDEHIQRESRSVCACVRARVQCRILFGDRAVSSGWIAPFRFDSDDSIFRWKVSDEVTMLEKMAVGYCATSATGETGLIPQHPEHDLPVLYNKWYASRNTLCILINFLFGTGINLINCCYLKLYTILL